MKLKEEFTFQYKNQSIQVKLCGEVYCAIFGKTAKPLKIEILDSGPHKGKISTREGKFLSWLPKSAFDEKAILKQIQYLLTFLNLEQ